MRSYSKLFKGDLKSTHPVSEHVLGTNNEPVSDHQELFCVEGHIRAQPVGRVNPCNLNKLLVDILFNDLIQFLPGGKKVSGAFREYRKGGR